MNNKSIDICSLESVNSRINDRIEGLGITDELAIANAKICMYQEEIIGINKTYEIMNAIRDRIQENDESIIASYKDLFKKETKNFEDEQCWTIYYRVYGDELEKEFKKVVDRDTFERIRSSIITVAKRERMEWRQYLKDKHKEDSDD